MANTSINLVGLDFPTLKDNLKTFLKTNTQFKDIDYEGSNINVLIDLLAYNTYLNAYYTNMVASEMFLDTAQLRDSVSSHAKELNYLPRSFNSAKANITVDITPTSSVQSIVVPAHTSFTSRVGSNTYTFSTAESYVLTDSLAGVFSLTADVFEGNLLTEAFQVNRANTNQRFIISNRSVDVSSLAVTVYEDGGDTTINYTYAEDIYNIDESTTVFFMQAGMNGQYEIVFGDDVFGRRPKDGALVVAEYRAASGELPNGARTFVPDGPIDGHTSIKVTTNDVAAGGALYESIESIKYNAPRAFQTQSRAVTENDYETLLQNKFPDIQTISAYGGETISPPTYGRVYIAVDVKNADGTPQSRKDTFYNFIKTKTPVSVEVEFVDPEFTYVKVETSVKYNVNRTRKTSADIESLVQAAISSYNDTNLEKFKATLYSSALISAIDNADTSMVGNDTKMLLVKRVVPTTKEKQRIVINTYNALEPEESRRTTATEQRYGHTLVTSAFTYENSRCILTDDSNGYVYIVTETGASTSDSTIVIKPLKRVGTINYTTGRVVISDFIIDSYEGNYLEFKFQTESNDIKSSLNTILKIDPIDVNITVVPVRL